MSEYVKVSINDGIALVQIDRSKALNALNRDIVNEIGEIVSEIKADKSVRGLIIGGTENFAAGADIKQMINCTPEEAGEFAFSPEFNRIESLSIPTIAAVEGYCLGGGLELALTCDMIIASESAKMGFPETGLGIMPGAGGTVRLPEAVGYARAKELIFTGKTIDGSKAYEIGLVNCVVEEGKTLDTAIEWMSKISKNGPVAISVAKQMINDSGKIDKPSAIALEGERWKNLFNTADQKEGMDAFISKRKPEFLGR